MIRRRVTILLLGVALCATAAPKPAKQPKPNAVVATLKNGATVVVTRNTCWIYSSMSGNCLFAQDHGVYRVILKDAVLHMYDNDNAVFNANGDEIGTYITTHLNLPEASWQAVLSDRLAAFARANMAAQQARQHQLQHDLQRDELNSQMQQLRQQLQRANDCLSYGNCY